MCRPSDKSHPVGTQLAAGNFIHVHSGQEVLCTIGGMNYLPHPKLDVKEPILMMEHLLYHQQRSRYVQLPKGISSFHALPHPHSLAQQLLVSCAVIG